MIESDIDALPMVGTVSDRGRLLPHAANSKITPPQVGSLIA